MGWDRKGWDRVELSGGREGRDGEETEDRNIKVESWE